MDLIGTTILADNIQAGTWTPKSDATVQPAFATTYAQGQNAYGLTMILYESNTSYVAWLTSTDVPVSPMPTHFYFEYTLVIDDPTNTMAYGIQTQIKMTDGSNPTWTYSIPAQWLPMQSWALAIGATNTNVSMPPPNPYTPVYVALECILDTVNHQGRINSFWIGRTQFMVPTIWTPAVQQGWGANVFHPQLLQVNNTVVPGGFTTHFSRISLTQ